MKQKKTYILPQRHKTGKIMNILYSTFCTKVHQRKETSQMCLHPLFWYEGIHMQYNNACLRQMEFGCLKWDLVQDPYAFPGFIVCLFSQIAFVCQCHQQPHHCATRLHLRLGTGNMLARLDQVPLLLCVCLAALR